MYAISESCKEALDKVVRDESYVQVTFGLVDVDAPSTSTLTDNGHLSFSDVNKIDDDPELEIDTTFQTLELNRFILDGHNEVMENKTDYLYQGYCGEVISKDDCTFDKNPVITITFAEITEMAGLTLFFDKYLNNYATEVRIKAYNNNETALDKVYNPTGYSFVTPDTIPPCNKVEITCVKTSIPNRRFRVSKLIYGIIFMMDDNVITKANLKTKVSVLSQELPEYTFDLQFLDFDKLYAPDNPQSRAKYVDSGQYLRYELRQTLPDGTLERIPMAYVFTNGELKTTDINIGEQVEIKGVDQLSLLEGTFYQDKYYPDGITYYDLLVKILTQANYDGEYIIDDYLKTLKTKVVINKLSWKESIQTVCNAGGCDIFFDRLGVLNIKKHNEDYTDFHFDYAKVTNSSTLSRTPQLRNVISKYASVSISNPAEELGTTEIDTPVTNAVVEIEYDPATEITYNASGLTVVGTPTIYATRFVATVSGSGSITVSGKYVTSQYSSITRHYNDLGTDFEVYNELIDSREYCERYIEENGNNYLRRNSYEFENRGYPQLDCLDVPEYETTFTPKMRSLIIENTINFDGSISGKTKVVSFQT